MKMAATQGGHTPRIVAGVDGSPSSRAALRWAAGQARLTGGTVDAVIAWHFPATGNFGWAPVSAVDDLDFEEMARKTLDEVIGDLADQAAGVPIRRLVVQGIPAQVLLDAAEGADLLVVGSRGHGGFADALLGSVSQHCVHHAPCPVVVMRGEENASA
jgi:nucleotide-binding universal stress UspA family protein